MQANPAVKYAVKSVSLIRTMSLRTLYIYFPLIFFLTPYYNNIWYFYITTIQNQFSNNRIDKKLIRKLLNSQVKDKGKDMKTAYKGLKWKGICLIVLIYVIFY